MPFINNFFKFKMFICLLKNWFLNRNTKIDKKSCTPICQANKMRIKYLHKTDDWLIKGEQLITMTTFLRLYLKDKFSTPTNCHDCANTPKLYKGIHAEPSWHTETKASFMNGWFCYALTIVWAQASNKSPSAVWQYSFHSSPSHDFRPLDLWHWHISLNARYSYVYINKFNFCSQVNRTACSLRIDLRLISANSRS